MGPDSVHTSGESWPIVLMACTTDITVDDSEAQDDACWVAASVVI